MRRVDVAVPSTLYNAEPGTHCLTPERRWSVQCMSRQLAGQDRWLTISLTTQCALRLININ